MSCTCRKWESLHRHSLLLHLIHIQLWKNMLKTMHVSKTVENCWICLPLRNRLFLRLCPACVIDMHCVSGECTVVVFCFCFFFCIRICIIVLDILTFQDRFLYLYKTKIRKNKLYVFGQYFIFRKYHHSYREVIDNFLWLCQCKLNDLPSDKIFVIIKESEYCSNWGEQCEFKLQLPVLLSKLAQQRICCDTHSIA
jgi:hypothetical protein